MLSVNTGEKHEYVSSDGLRNVQKVILWFMLLV